MSIFGAVKDTNPQFIIIMKGKYYKLFEKYPDIISVDHLTEMLHIGKSSAYSLLHSNQIQHVRVGKKYIIPKQAVLSFASGMCYADKQIIGGRPHLVTEGDIAL